MKIFFSKNKIKLKDLDDAIDDLLLDIKDNGFDIDKNKYYSDVYRSPIGKIQFGQKKLIYHIGINKPNHFYFSEIEDSILFMGNILKDRFNIDIKKSEADFRHKNYEILFEIDLLLIEE